MPRILLFIYAFLLACLVWAIGTSIWIYDRHRHEHVEHLEGGVYRKDDVVIDAVQSFQRPGREKVVCYRESHRNFYIFIFQMTVGILVVTGVGIVVNVRLNGKLRRTNKEVSAQKAAVEEQKSALEIQKKATDEANAQVMASLRYAEKLQTGILMRHEDLVAAHPDSFLLNRPKSGIGGDFCFTMEHAGERIICVGDCTGHGVPGAILAVLAFTLIRQIVEEGQTTPKLILDTFLERFQGRLGGQGENDDKAEVMIARIQPDAGFMEFAANGARAYWTNGEEIRLIEGAGQETLPNGGYLYFSSDGYADQIGGPDSKRMLRKRFMAVMQEIVSLPPAEQVATLAQRLDAWRGAEVQTDDVIVLGWPLAA